MSAWMTGRRRCRGQRGAGRAFTLVEMMAVLVIMSLVMAMIIPAMSAMTRSRNMVKATEGLRGELMRARNLAIADGKKPYYVHFFEKTNSPLSNKVQVCRMDGTAPNPGGGTGDPVVAEPFYLPESIQLDIGGMERYPFIVFTATGAAAGPTNTKGIYLTRRVAFAGKVAVDAVGLLTFQVAGVNWTPDDRWKEHVIVFRKLKPPATDLLGESRVVRGSAATTLTVATAWSSAPQQDDEFILVAAEDVERLIIYSTTGRMRLEGPP